VTTAANPDVIQTLTEDLSETGHLPAGARWRRLRGGRTNHVWHVTGPGTGTPVVVKLYDQRGENPLFPNCPEDEAKVLLALAGKGLAPRLLHHGRTTQGDCLIYSHLQGVPWRRDPAAAGSLLHALHQVDPPEDLRETPDGSRAIEQQIDRILSACPTNVAQGMPPLPRSTVAPSGAACLLHGDPVPGNVIDCATGLRLIDWQCPATGDPCEDIALFLSPAMQIAYRGMPLSKVEENEFLSAYGCDRTVTRYLGLAPWYHARSLAYCLWQVHQGDAAAALRAKAEQDALQNGA
jgi:hypothetical protein